MKNSLDEIQSFSGKDFNILQTRPIFYAIRILTLTVGRFSIKRSNRNDYYSEQRLIWFRKNPWIQKRARLNGLSLNVYNYVHRASPPISRTVKYIKSCPSAENIHARATMHTY